MIKIETYKPQYAKQCGKLIYDVYKQFNIKEGTPYAVQRYLDYHNPTNSKWYIVEQRFNQTPIFLVAKDKNKIIGLIKGTKDRVTSLYIHAKYHKKGIGKTLLKIFEKLAKQKGSKKIKINASIYASQFYQKNGYKKSTGIRNMIGLLVQPVKKTL